MFYPNVTTLRSGTCHRKSVCRRLSIVVNLNTSTTWFLSNPVATHVLHLWSLLLVHLPGPLSKSLIALFSTLHLVYGTNSPLIFVSLVRHSLLHFHLSHMAYHHHPPYHLHDHHLHLLLLVLSFILNLRLGSLPNHFLHRPSPFLPDWFHGLTDHLTFYSPQRLDLFAWCVRLSRLLVGFRTHFKSLHFLSFFFLLGTFSEIVQSISRLCKTAFNVQAKLSDKVMV